MPPRKSVSDRIEDLRKQREEIDNRIRSLEALKREARDEKEITFDAVKASHQDRKMPYWMKSGRHG
ncbi:hypothetical protein [Fontibacillus sp. BL9]|uniref:hypothetical protein n=1 Tax=Fontibacillus sp. BL9 TaxID=3389971 RepID=UPI00397826D5